ncbi:hypothetical protein LF41_599 [Lysobacter dokdonensis DS-58]|uniref:Transmembrane protein n=1 Tax=Lysobacter dokdonensis DS-58 TaxID=1300345 RepID=A0A0A2WFP7_9GAMM|nr:hypothetical protein [Lysobacter dokdonensis]KGQ18573.1 hypothetical protein LF41_599 [Lysobacter dokdonensis DS-58]
MFDATIQLIGYKGLLLLIAAYLGIGLILSFPALWAWWRARRERLEQRRMFVLVVWGFAFGATGVASLMIELPLAVYTVFFAPEFYEMKLISATRHLDAVVEYWWVGMPVVEVIAAVWATRYFARRWRFS